MLDGQEFAELWNKLTPTQKRFAVAMQEHPTKKEAAEAIGINPQTSYNWNGDVDAVIEYMTNNIALATLGILQANATKAAMVKARGLDSKNEKIAQDVATEIIERNIGKVPQRNENREITWQDEVLDALRKGELTVEEAMVLYPDLASDFFKKAGVDAAS